MNQQPTKKPRGRPPKPIPFKEVLYYVNKGVPIYKACKNVGLDSGAFYKKMNKEQRVLLDMARLQHSEYGATANYRAKGKIQDLSNIPKG